MEALGIDVLFKGTNMMRLLQGLWIGVQISGISVALSLVLGVLLGIFMMWENPVARAISRLYLEIVGSAHKVGVRKAEREGPSRRIVGC